MDLSDQCCGAACLGTTQPTQLSGAPRSRGPRGTRFLPMGIENDIFFGPVRNWVNAGLKLEDKQYCYRYVRCFISVLLCIMLKVKYNSYFFIK